jgi:hypothetical protein
MVIQYIYNCKNTCECLMKTGSSGIHVASEVRVSVVELHHCTSKMHNGVKIRLTLCIVYNVIFINEF